MDEMDNLLLRETVDVPGLGAMTVREMTQDDYADWVAEWDELDPKRPATRRRYAVGLVRRTVMNGDGQSRFPGEDAGRLPPRILRLLVEVAERINGLSPDALKDAKKNSESGQDGLISTSSPATSASGT